MCQDHFHDDDTGPEFSNSGRFKTVIGLTSVLAVIWIVILIGVIP